MMNAMNTVLHIKAARGRMSPVRNLAVVLAGAPDHFESE